MGPMAEGPAAPSVPFRKTSLDSSHKIPRLEIYQQFVSKLLRLGQTRRLLCILMRALPMPRKTLKAIIFSILFSLNPPVSLNLRAQTPDLRQYVLKARAAYKDKDYA